MKHLLKWFSILMIVALGTCHMVRAAAVPTSPIETTEERLRQATVALVSVDPSEKGAVIEATCAGVWVTHTEFITAAHCVEPKDNLVLGLKVDADAIGITHTFLTLNDLGEQGDETKTVVKLEKIRVARVTAYDARADLALLDVTLDNVPRSHPVITVSQKPLVIGTSVHIIGHTNSLWWSYARGFIAASRKMSGPHDHPIHVLQVTAPVWHGNSGGGAFNESGQLVGLSSFIMKGPNLGFFVHRDVLLAFLTRHGLA